MGGPGPGTALSWTGAQLRIKGSLRGGTLGWAQMSYGTGTVSTQQVVSLAQWLNLLKPTVQYVTCTNMLYPLTKHCTNSWQYRTAHYRQEWEDNDSVSYFAVLYYEHTHLHQTKKPTLISCSSEYRALALEWMSEWKKEAPNLFDIYLPKSRFQSRWP